MLKLSNEDVYTGYFRAGLRHGEGVVVFAAGDSFEGLWRQVRQEGRGEGLSDDLTQDTINDLRSSLRSSLNCRTSRWV